MFPAGRVYFSDTGGNVFLLRKISGSQRDHFIVLSCLYWFLYWVEAESGNLGFRVEGEERRVSLSFCLLPHLLNEPEGIRCISGDCRGWRVVEIALLLGVNRAEFA